MNLYELLKIAHSDFLFEKALSQPLHLHGFPPLWTDSIEIFWLLFYEILVSPKIQTNGICMLWFNEFFTLFSYRTNRFYWTFCKRAILLFLVKSSLHNPVEILWFNQDLKTPSKLRQNLEFHKTPRFENSVKTSSEKLRRKILSNCQSIWIYVLIRKYCYMCKVKSSV